MNRGPGHLTRNRETQVFYPNMNPKSVYSPVYIWQSSVHLRSLLWESTTNQREINKSVSQFSHFVVADFCEQASLSITNSQNLLKLMSIESVMPSTYLILCCPLLLLPSVFPRIRIFSNESVLHIRWPKYWSFCFNISPSNEYSGLISFRMDWFELLTVQGILKSLQHHSSKASVHQKYSALFMAQLSHPYMTRGKTTALTRQTFGSAL